ncbi:uncharacterized protein [Diabrotica undecimpunctata]|uniref:uncharacterized protein isoform X1 n=1 Tax=Diabrotica undecimpunctata TaxID=50387 RepID=UPI003B6331E9
MLQIFYFPSSKFKFKMIKVYRWGPNFPSFGHISMKLSDGTYVSFWPSNPLSIGNSRDNERCTYESDSYDEKRPADEILEIPADADTQDRIKRFWKDYLVKYKYSYHLLTNNCATIVKRAFKHGWPTQVDYNSFQMIDTPNYVFYWATQKWGKHFVVQFMEEFCNLIRNMSMLCIVYKLLLEPKPKPKQIQQGKEIH